MGILFAGREKNPIKRYPWTGAATINLHGRSWILETIKTGLPWLALVITFVFLGALLGKFPDGDSVVPSNSVMMEDSLNSPKCKASVSLPASTPTASQQKVGQVQAPYRGIWISKEELAALPTSGPAWDALKEAAYKNAGRPNVKNQNDNNDIYTLAEALVYARTGETTYRMRVLKNLEQVIGTEKGGRTLAVSRNVVSYVIAADLINLPADPAEDQKFRAWLCQLLVEDLYGRTLRGTQAERANNWGTHAGASRAAIAIYLGDKAELERTALIFRGYLGDRSAYSSFTFDKDKSWQCDPGHPVGINPKGCQINGHSLDGALPEEMRRGKSFRWPPAKTGYAWEGLQGALVTAELLSRAGYPAWEWQDQALLRAVNFLYDINWKPIDDDEGYVWLVNHAYGIQLPANTPAQAGKNIGWLDWMYSKTNNTLEKHPGGLGQHR